MLPFANACGICPKLGYLSLCLQGQELPGDLQTEEALSVAACHGLNVACNASAGPGHRLGNRR